MIHNSNPPSDFTHGGIFPHEPHLNLHDSLQFSVGAPYNGL